jgi:diadenosine tetraphosphatase ApaH/serine/threonine PP2A family protein phosphatase
MRYAILSDIHANLTALEAVLEDLVTQSIQSMLFLGDAIGYYADGPAVLARLRELVIPRPCVVDGRAAVAAPWVAGNHEWGLIGRLPPEHFSAAALAALMRTMSDLSGQDQTLLHDLPERIELELEDGLTVTLLHASPLDPVGVTGAGYMENGEDAREAANAFTSQICLIGHTHYPRVLYESVARAYGDVVWETSDVFEEVLPGGCYHFANERLYLNPGSVGQPRDGDPRASYGILDTTERMFCVRRVAYDIATTAAHVRSWLADAPAELLEGQGGLAGRLYMGI